MPEKTLAEWTRIVTGLAADGVEVIRLKLRIIGFSNKLTGLYARLGEAAFNRVESGEPFTGQESAQRLVDDIRDARREIKEAEEGIETLRAARAAAKGEPAPASRPLPADPDDDRKEG